MLVAKIRADFRHKRDVYQADIGDASWLRILLADGTSAMVLYRCMECSRALGIVPLAYLFQYLNKLINQCVIGARAQFGMGFVLVHPCGVVINSSVRGGERVVLESGVVIGAEKGHSPVIGNQVFVGAGAKIIGGIIVGDDVKIGANAVVVKSVDRNKTVVGIPAREITKL